MLCVYAALSATLVLVGATLAAMYVNDQLAELQRRYGARWDMWWVPCYPNGYTWHARPLGSNGPATIDADSPERLAEIISQAEVRPSPSAGAGSRRLGPVADPP